MPRTLSLPTTLQEIATECDLPRLHLIGIFHTQHTAAYSHCAFTGKALRFPKMMQGQRKQRHQVRPPRTIP